ncbi:hypothetical protein CDD81_2205 [Ophiocordyceps australis]|uniref:CoA-binding domain-containing protein n=1 Tax=Ophiocordyceps australis TaxID=1399860 RepID=A0A2C5XZF7_9HYPO|nr:hypothetical protein CDD81_2205 [Ophiocordyceps australis]
MITLYEFADGFRSKEAAYERLSRPRLRHRRRATPAMGSGQDLGVGKTSLLQTPASTTLEGQYIPVEIMSAEAAARSFFSSPLFAVVGATSNTAKFGHKGGLRRWDKKASSSKHGIEGALMLSAVYAWYLAHGLPATPVNPSAQQVTVQGKEYATAASLADLPRPSDTSVSIITPPAVTTSVLQEARKLGIPAVWLQPGTYDKGVLELALADGAFKSVVYGNGGRGSEGWCVLVDGERALADVGKL